MEGVEIKALEEFYKGKTVLITGHTGFKGAWLCVLLNRLGAKVVGYALKPPTSPSLFELLAVEKMIVSHEGDIRNMDNLNKVVEKASPDIVIHMAAQPLVRQSYVNPVETYETNVLGTVYILECCRRIPSVRSIINVTTDKVYRNNEWEKGYVESDYLDGYDPYSNSKSCSELVTHSYVQSFFGELGIPVSTCRAGNVIGGGDFATDRIIPDCVRAASRGEEIIVRNAFSVRPYQHVLEPLYVYLLLAMRQYENYEYAGAYNVGPEDEDCITTGELVTLFCDKWNNSGLNSDLKWKTVGNQGPHEANLLKLDCDKLKSAFNWQQKWHIEKTVEKIVEFEQLRISGANGNQLRECIAKQIEEFLNV